jgi:hypothetical protein
MGSLLIPLQINPTQDFSMEKLWDCISFEALQRANNFPLLMNSQ